jgi:hypothetical protein
VALKTGYLMLLSIFASTGDSAGIAVSISAGSFYHPEYEMSLISGK